MDPVERESKAGRMSKTKARPESPSARPRSRCLAMSSHPPAVTLLKRVPREGRSCRCMSHPLSNQLPKTLAHQDQAPVAVARAAAIGWSAGIRGANDGVRPFDTVSRGSLEISLQALAASESRVVVMSAIDPWQERQEIPLRCSLAPFPAFSQAMSISRESRQIPPSRRQPSIQGPCHVTSLIPIGESERSRNRLWRSADWRSLAGNNPRRTRHIWIVPRPSSCLSCRRGSAVSPSSLGFRVLGAFAQNSILAGPSASANASTLSVQVC
ncbi:hypothetical protein QBC47DRAFT_19100 [Echria macrotheca]|uniref:Uncharacterized protein n=1 Tax=Echria macrotheca TaxID=438768 RepID=A0AAJ0BN09_9PEZI|nr:hypothetical protein QBC47DRAFT_19100 [Echria macrotheca]